MCELLGLSFNTPISPTFSFKGLITRSYHHCNGWGLGCYPGGSKSAQVFKEEVSGATSVLAKFLAEFSDLRSKTFIGHIRKASQGVESYDNTHPFNRLSVS